MPVPASDLFPSLQFPDDRPAAIVATDQSPPVGTDAECLDPVFVPLERVLTADRFNGNAWRFENRFLLSRRFAAGSPFPRRFVEDHFVFASGLGIDVPDSDRAIQAR